jgi:predicted O-methyltransferase YrrM
MMNFKPERIGVIAESTAEMLLPERLLLYAFVAGIQPSRSLEIGSHTGGSASIITAAMDDVGRGTLVCVDPDPRIPAQILAQISHRAIMIRGRSPEDLSRASKAVNGRFEFAFIDGDHSTLAVVRDTEGLLPFLEETAYLLFHDVHHPEVNAAINILLRDHSDELTDCGIISVEKSEAPVGSGIFWGGLKAVRFIDTKSSIDRHRDWHRT